MSITHIKVSSKSDGADPSLIQPSDWNADHNLVFNVVGVQFSFDPSGYDPDSRNWNFNSQDFVNPNGTRKNTIMNFGYNVSPGGGSLDLTDHSLYWQFENYYKPDGNPATAEAHLNFFGAGNVFDRRPLQFNINVQNGYVESFVTIDKINFGTPSGTQLGNWTDGTLVLNQKLAVGGGSYHDATIDIYAPDYPMITFRRGTTAERAKMYHDGTNFNFLVQSGGFNFQNTDGFCSFTGKTLLSFSVESQTGFEMDAAGGAARISFYGVSNVARQLLATGAGHSVDDVITALQNLGLVKQS